MVLAKCVVLHDRQSYLVSTEIKRVVCIQARALPGYPPHGIDDFQNTSMLLSAH